MKLSRLAELPTSRYTIDVFGGYNHNLRIGEGEFYEMKNLTSDDYPILSPRHQRGTYNVITPENPCALIAKDALCYIDIVTENNAYGAKLYINGNENAVEGLKLSSLKADLPKTLVSMGSYVIIMPDKKWVNTNDDTYGNIEATVTTKTDVTFTPCKLDGTDFSNDKVTIKDEAPASPNDLDYWIDTSTIPHTLKQYSATSAMWVSVATTYIKISATDIGVPFDTGDGVTISGIEAEALADLNTTMVVQGRGDNYIIVIGIIDETKTQKTPITVSRKMPNMDFIIESENRLWGCRYGLSVDNEFVNEIYASKLGDFKNWNSFQGISTDSYAVSLGTDGPFTGAITHIGYPIFFKENYMHKIYGNYPANYQIQTTACRGVQKGCSKSLAIVNEILYYKSRSAICTYDGSLPVEISSALGDVVYSDAVAGVLRNKYYISMRDVNETDPSKLYHLFVYDTQKGMWHKEDNTQVRDFCNCDGELYYIDVDTKAIKTVRGTGLTDTKPIKWEAITGIIGTESPDKKYLSRIVLRGTLEVGTTLYLQAQYDSSGTWEQVFSMSAATLKTFSIPVRPRRCDHLRLRFIGQGEAKIFSITKTFEQGSDM